MANKGPPISFQFYIDYYLLYENDLSLPWKFQDLQISKSCRIWNFWHLKLNFSYYFYEIDLRVSDLFQAIFSSYDWILPF